MRKFHQNSLNIIQDPQTLKLHCPICNGVFYELHQNPLYCINTFDCSGKSHLIAYSEIRPIPDDEPFNILCFNYMDFKIRFCDSNSKQTKFVNNQITFSTLSRKNKMNNCIFCNEQLNSKKLCENHYPFVVYSHSENELYVSNENHRDCSLNIFVLNTNDCSIKKMFSHIKTTYNPKRLKDIKTFYTKYFHKLKSFTKC
jgi:hypothetical protein